MGFTFTYVHIHMGFTCVKQTCNQDCRLHFFSLRALNRWNSLTQELVDSESVNSFKSGFEKLRKRKMGFFMD